MRKRYGTMRKRYGRRRLRRYGRGRRMRKRRIPFIRRLAKKIKRIEDNTVVSKIALANFNTTVGSLINTLNSPAVGILNLCDLDAYTVKYPAGASKITHDNTLTGSTNNITWDKLAVCGYLDRRNELDPDVIASIAFVVPRTKRVGTNPLLPQDISLGQDGRIYMDPNNWKILYQKVLINTQGQAVVGPENMVFTPTYNARAKFMFTKKWKFGRSVEVDINGSPRDNTHNIYMVTATNNLTEDNQSPSVYGTCYFRYRDGAA